MKSNLHSRWRVEWLEAWGNLRRFARKEGCEGSSIRSLALDLEPRPGWARALAYAWLNECCDPLAAPLAHRFHYRPARLK